MARNSFASAHARRRAKNAKPIPDSQLDLSDIPESTAAELRRARRVGRPATGNAKQLKPYQTLIHELLEKSARKVA
jgi:hypothetical protein